MNGSRGFNSLSLPVLKRVFPTWRVAFLCLSAFVGLVLVGGCAGLEDTPWGDITLGGNSGPLDEKTVVAGLKEALRVGTDRSVLSTSQEDGFWGNALIKIVLPEQLDSMAGTLRDIGLGGQVDQFERTMNRAAELAAGEATDLFWDAIAGMTIADGFAILNGPDNAATEYFQGRTANPMRTRFRPIVDNKMSELGLFEVYQTLLDRYAALPLVDKPDLDLVGYITEGTVGGLFTILAQEEQRIREDPLARTTELLRRVFGR